MPEHFSLALYLLASITFFVDLLDLLLRVYLRREQTVSRQRRGVAATSIPLEIGNFTPYEVSQYLRPYAIVAAVHNLAPDLLNRFLAAMQPYRDRLWIIDDASNDDTWERLQAAGVRAIRARSNLQKPGAIKALLAELPAHIVTVMVVDPDARIVSDVADFERVLFEFQRSDAAALCPRICVRSDGFLTRFQQLEYSLSFSIGRKALADFTITSGIALYRRKSLEEVLAQHTLSVYGEDLENALLLLVNRQRVYYDGRLVVETDGVASVRRLFSQRVGWSFGLIKVYVEHWRELLRESRRGAMFVYQYIFYLGILVLLFHPLKLIGLTVLLLSALKTADDVTGLHRLADSAIISPIYFSAVYVKYSALVLATIPLAVRRIERRDVLIIVPLYMFYAVAQVLPSTVGYLNWFTERAWGRRVYHDHYQPVSG
jgi:cellulose synthase/poly-beta-1,6-N-acetylglucosamine synthase-like glycosyltransferase